MKYETAVPIGRGASGEVFKAWDPSRRRTVALKFFPVDLEPAAAERRKREVEAQRRLDHPSICEIYEVGTTDAGRHFLAMRYVDGEPLDVVARRLPLHGRVELLRQVCDAVGCAHRAGLVHRDLKPSNILVEEREDGVLQPFVLDFGIVRLADATQLTETGQVLGTPGYMAPEQARGAREIDARSDVFSLGVLLYQLLTDEVPFAATSGVGALLRVLEHDPPLASSGRPEVPRELAHIAEKALEKDPRRRYPDANALQRELSRYLEAGAVSARGIGRVGRILRLVERRPLPWAIGSCLGLIAVVFLAIAVRNQLVSERQARAAERFARRSAEIESEVRFEELLPLHSIAAQRPRLLAARERLASDVKKSDGRARAAGEYAVGRVDLALDEAQSAEQRLTRARALGFDDPEGALTLAEAMIEQGRSDLRAVDLVHDSEVRAAERERLRDQLRAEVLPLLNEATRAAGFGRESQLMALALVAQLEDRAQEADDLAREVIELSPWMYEADLVRADVLRQSASLSRSNGEIEAAKALQGRERDLLENALERAPSALSLRERLCESWMLTAQTDLDATSSKDTWETSFAAAERACEKALVILPDALGPRALVVEIGWRRALQRLRRLGAEAVAEDVEVLVAQAEALQQLAPEGYRENWNLGNALYAWARVERERGESPVATLERSARALQRGLEHAPGLAFGWQSLGITWTEHGNALEARGENPIPSYERALQAFAEGRGGSKAQLSRLENALCNAQLGIAYYISQHPGAAPRERVDRALSQASEACERALAVLPGYLSALSNLALTHWTEVEWRITQDESPEAAARAATRSFDELLSLAPEHVSGRINRAGMTAAFVQWQLDSQDGAPIATDDRLRQVIREVRAARTSVAPLAANFPGDVHTHLARLATLEAAAVCTLDPTAEEIEELWAGAERATRRLAEASAIPREVLLRQAQYHRRSAECRARTTSGASSSQGPAVAALREGISAIEQSLKVDPDFVEAKREQAILLRLLARARETHAPADA